MIVIKGIEMPSSCYDCPFAKNKRTNDYGSFCECEILEDYETINLLEHSKHPNCPLIKQEPILDRVRAEIESLERFEIRGEKTPLVNGDKALEIIDKYKSESEPQESIEKGLIPYLMHKEMGVPLLECQKAYEIAMEYLRSQAKLKG